MTARRIFETVFVGTDRNAVSTVRDMRREAESLQRTQARGTTETTRLQRANGLLNNTYVRQGIALAGVSVGIAGVVQATRGAITAASNLEEAQNKVNVVFGEAADSVHEFSENAASIGLSTRMAEEAAGAFGNMFNTIGLAEQESARMSTTMVQLAADMASFNNEDPSAMLERLRSGLAGEAEPLRRFGVLLSAARVEQAALTLGISDGTRALTEQEKVAARYAIILQDTAVQQGDFARTSDGLANSTRTLAAEWENLNAELGKFITPIAAQAVSALADIVAALNAGIGPAVDFASAVAELNVQLGSLARISVGDVARAVVPFDWLVPGSGGGGGTSLSGFARFGYGSPGANVFDPLNPEAGALPTPEALRNFPGLSQVDFLPFFQLMDMFTGSVNAAVSGGESAIAGGGGGRGGGGIVGFSEALDEVTDWANVWGTLIVPPLHGELLKLTTAAAGATEAIERETSWRQQLLQNAGANALAIQAINPLIDAAAVNQDINAKLAAQLGPNYGTINNNYIVDGPMGAVAPIATE